MVIIISHSFGKLMYFQSFNDTALPEQFNMRGKVLSQIVKLRKSYLILFTILLTLKPNNDVYKLL